ncbi:MAG TPA: DoxX family protein [Thermoleophilaceae bacterium]|jgi:putative oxidoreductase
MDTGLAVLHIVVGLLFVGHGAQKLFGAFGGHGLEGTAGFFESLGFRPGRFHAFAAGVNEFAGGALLALGLLVPLAAALIIATMLAASLTAHAGKGIWNQNSGIELPLVYGTIAFALTAVGAGDASLDSALGLDVHGLGWAIAALAAGALGGLGAVASGRLTGTEPVTG